MKTLLLVIFFINIFFIASAQSENDSSIISPAFYEYLQKNNLYNESISLLQIVDSTHSLYSEKNFLLYRNYSHLHNTDSAFRYLSLCKQLPSRFNDTLLYCAFILKDSLWLRINRTSFNLNDEDNLCLKLILNETVQAEKYSDKKLSFEVSTILDNYTAFKDKSPITAGVASAIIPGLGKAYLGYKHQALSAFIINGFLAALAVESIGKGYTSFRFIASTSVFATFYIGNIWGSVSLAKKRRIDFKNQINEDISQYYYYRVY